MIFLKGSAGTCCFSTRVVEERFSTTCSLVPVLSVAALGVFLDGGLNCSLDLLRKKLSFVSQFFGGVLSLGGGNLGRLSSKDSRLSVDIALYFVDGRFSGKKSRFCADESKVFAELSNAESLFCVDGSLNRVGECVSRRESIDEDL